jgi:hypothetical protein
MNETILIGRKTKALLHFIEECHRRGIPVSQEDYTAAGYAVAAAKDADDDPIRRDELKMVV